MGDKENDKTHENEIKLEPNKSITTEEAIVKATKLIEDQTIMIATYKSKITQLSDRCRELYKANINLEELNVAHKELNGKLRVELSSLKPKGIKLSWDTNQKEKETTVFGTKV